MNQSYKGLNMFRQEVPIGNDCKSVVVTQTGTYREHVLSLWNKELNTEQTLTAAAMGLSGEAGEVTDLIKKVIFHKHDLDKDKLIKELGDVFYYAEVLMNQIGVSRKDVENKNLEKLIKRYPQGFSPEASKNRKE